MKIKIIFIGASVFLYAFFSVPFANAGTEKIIISEVQIGGVKADDEFVELYNPNAAPIDISSYRLRYRNSAGTEGSLNKIGNNTCIATHGYYLWANSNGAFADIADTKTGTGLSAKYSLALMLPENSTNPLIDSVSWENSYPFDGSYFKFSKSPVANQSMVRDVTTGNWLLDFSSTPTPTKSTDTACPHSDSDHPIIYDSDVRINELLANPSGDEGDNEFIELFNTSDKVIDLSLWAVKDASASGKYIFPNNTEIEPKDFLVVYRTDFVFALNNSDETVSLLDPNGAEKDKVSYKTAKEDISWNYTLTGWRGGTPTPGKINQPNNLPETSEKVPDEGYKGVEVNFDAKGKDSDNDALKYTWDFGDGHKSYKEITTHTYEENGTYTVTLKTTDGKDDTLETFTIKIESMPRKDVRITSLLPNPSGNDTGNEWLLIENREKKSVNLKDYSIAVGWKKLSNHPIREDFIIGPKKEAKLTHDFSLFTLPNQKGKIELRAPDGKVLQDIKYKLDKPVAEDAVYHKEKGSAWKWEALPKKIGAAPQKGIVPLVPVPQETKPVEIIQPIQEDAPVEPIKTKSDQISLDPNRPLPQDILAYDMQVQMPDSIILTIPPDEKINLIPLSESSSLPEEESLFAKINTSLNDFLNNSQEK